ncbi:MAG: tRNA (5-methylaminomethyl-2-thiouridine)(34)-methyltransferase MnmD [Muribaculaceae bacterium]|nr:tRNA (5-methylaminomethyl-2-thiouridine)(34)-methyltransferase MnmD [Muribaculaceae bacterium]
MEDYLNPKVEVTGDGSATIYLPEMDEHYHSVKGALAESRHIYRDCGFLHRSDGQRLRLLEVGFGSGLNAVVTAMAANESRPVHYITLEKFPVDGTLLRQLGHDRIADASLYDMIQAAEWDTPVEITPYFTLEKRISDYTADDLPEGIDIVYFDAFAPEKQPEMWTAEAFTRLRDVMNQGAVMTTYCAKGEIRRMLASLGFSVERLAGPVGGKREILRATL